MIRLPLTLTLSPGEREQQSARVGYSKTRPANAVMGFVPGGERFTLSIRFKTPMRVHSWRSKLPTNEPGRQRNDCQGNATYSFAKHAPDKSLVK